MSIKSLGMPPETHNIKLKIKDGELDLSDNGFTKAYKTDFIVWHLKNNSGIDSFRIETKSGADIFVIPPTKNGDLWIGAIKQDAAVDSQYVYAIKYRKTGDTTSITLDPIISIKPSTFIDLDILIPIIGGIILGLLGFWGISSFKKRFNNKSRM